MLEARPKSVSIETWADVRVVAALAEFFHSKDIQIGTKSRLVSLSLEAFHSALLSKGMVRDIESAEEAVQVLRRLGIDVMKGRRGRVTAKRLQVDALLEDEFDPGYKGKKPDPEEVVRRMGR